MAYSAVNIGSNIQACYCGLQSEKRKTPIRHIYKPFRHIYTHQGFGRCNIASYSATK